MISQIQWFYIFNQFPKFLKVYQKDKLRRFNLSLLLIFFLTFPNQNYYQSWQPASDKPLIRRIDFELESQEKYPVNQTGIQAPFLSARSVTVIDVPTKTVIYSKNPDLPLYPASTTKIMTALVALDFYKFDDILEVGPEEKIGQVIGLKTGERLTVENLLYGLLIGSGNDAAQVLAQNYPGGVDEFVKKMNEKGKSLHLDKTNFTNVSGIESWNHTTTTHDLAILTAEALKNPFIAQAVAAKKRKIVDVDGRYEHLIENTNKLIGTVAGVQGVKTGWTENAGECLVAFTKRDQGEIITVILGSSDRFGETVRLIDWVYNNFSWEFH